MAGHGFDTAKLTGNLDRLLGGWVETGARHCAQGLVIRHGEVAYDKAFGVSDLETKKPVARDSIYRIYSMSKVFTSAAMLMLMEEGRVKLNDPLSRFFPAFAKSQVVQYDAAGHAMLVPAKREIIIRDLFTMASGIPYPGGDTPSERAMGRPDEKIEAILRAGKTPDVMQMSEILAEVPLTSHPGEHWWYGYSIDVLGAVIEVITGKRLGDFFEERIFAPLGLVDTGFFVPESKRDRFVRMYDLAEDGTLGPLAPPEMDRDYLNENALFQSGGGGLTSTAPDVALFAQMLLGFGRGANGKRLLSRKSVEMMRMNALSERQQLDYWGTDGGYSYGLGVRTMLKPNLAGYGSVGEFAWDGMAGTWFGIDPEEDMVSVLMIQSNPGGHDRFIPYFAQVVYGAIDD